MHRVRSSHKIPGCINSEISSRWELGKAARFARDSQKHTRSLSNLPRCNFSKPNLPKWKIKGIGKLQVLERFSLASLVLGELISIGPSHGQRTCALPRDDLRSQQWMSSCLTPCRAAPALLPCLHEGLMEAAGCQKQSEPPRSALHPPSSRHCQPCQGEEIRL